jgi:hypothetical protein
MAMSESFRERFARPERDGSEE